MTQVLTAQQIDSLLSSEDQLPQLVLSSVEQKKDVRNLAIGVFAPLTGFLKKKDFHAVVTKMRLSSGEIWPIPIVLDISKQEKDALGDTSKVLLVDEARRPFALLSDIEVYTYDPDFFAKHVFGVNDRLHPGVDEVFSMKEFLIGGDISLINDDKMVFPDHNYTPEETKRIFNGRGWQKIVAFQTRNVPHRGHEFLQKEALKQVDGLFVQPIIGEKKEHDFKDEYIIASYEQLIQRHYPKNKAVLGVLPLKMRYAGPREAVLHAIIRRNYGCSHFIVGRDHAGVGNYYDPYASQQIFEQFPPAELGIEILKFPEVVWNTVAKKHMFVTKCPESNRESFSGTRIRKYIIDNEKPPGYLMRPEVFAALTERKNVLVDDLYKQLQHKIYRNHQGFVVWLTGLSQSGKSTIAERLYEILEDKNINAEILDGDVVRESLTKDLGFSKEDRDENIRRIGFVAKLLSRNKVGAICSFISPYAAQREGVRLQVSNYIEVFVNTPLEICEKWDRKGLYAKARSGEIDNFTGISAPYEKPKKPDIEVRPAKIGVDGAVKKILQYLEENRYI